MGVISFSTHEKSANGIKNVQIATGENYTLILKSDGSVWAWGNNFYGQLGDGTYNNSDKPVKVNKLNEIISVVAKNGVCLALKKMEQFGCGA